MDEMEVSRDGGPGKNRKRTKKLCNSILMQMQFWLGDANLNKDRFIKKEIDKSKDGWLPIDMFLGFNRMKNLTTDPNMIAKALAKSKFIEVSEDKTMVRRKTPIIERPDEDERTIYVECLPPEADHDWVKKVFGPYGQVLYVSMPRYHTSRDLKGYAFVEFDSIEAAYKAIEEMDNPPADFVDKFSYFPKKGSYDMQRLQEKLQRAHVSSDPPKRQRTISEPSAAMDDTKSHKRSRTVSEGDETNIKRPRTIREENLEIEDEPNESKQAKKSEENNQTSNKSDDADTKSAAKRKIVEENEENGIHVKKSKPENEGHSEGSNSEDEVRTESMEGTEKDGKKKRNRKKNKKQNKEDEKEAVPELHVISKMEWLKLREEYLAAQKQNMHDLKETLKEIGYSAAKYGEESVAMEDENSSRDAGHTKSPTQTQKQPREYKFTPNAILKVESTEPMKWKELKKALQNCGKIAYFDFHDGMTEGFIRCADAKTAENIVKAKVPNHTFSLLQGDAEMQYWEKLKNDREKKINKDNQATIAKEMKQPREYKFTPNVILKVESTEPMKWKELKKELQSCGKIAYFDFKDGMNEGFVRCADAETAENVVKAKVPYHTFSLLQGEAEVQYWEKLKSDREKKIKKEPKSNQVTNAEETENPEKIGDVSLKKKQKKKSGKEKLESKAEVIAQEIKEKNRLGST